MAASDSLTKGTAMESVTARYRLVNYAAPIEGTTLRCHVDHTRMFTTISEAFTAAVRMNDDYGRPDSIWTVRVFFTITEGK